MIPVYLCAEIRLKRLAVQSDHYLIDRTKLQCRLAKLFAPLIAKSSAKTYADSFRVQTEGRVARPRMMHVPGANRLRSPASVRARPDPRSGRFHRLRRPRSSSPESAWVLNSKPREISRWVMASDFAVGEDALDVADVLIIRRVNRRTLFERRRTGRDVPLHMNDLRRIGTAAETAAGIANACRWIPVARALDARNRPRCFARRTSVSVLGI